MSDDVYSSPASAAGNSPQSQRLPIDSTAGRDDGRVILTAEEMRRAISRIAHEIVERNAGASGLLLVGLQTRGRPLAERLAAKIGELEQVRVPTVPLDPTPYRDDRPRDTSRSAMPGPLAFDVHDKTVVLVDDVLFTGRTARCALDAVLGQGRPAKVQLAVLVDRGHRELPIRADFVGKNVPTALSESIHVRLTEIDGTDVVMLQRIPEQSAPPGET